MRITVMLAALCAAVLQFEPAQAQTRYPLQCHAGGNMVVNVIGGVAANTTEVIVSYTKATVIHAIPAGTCAWFDRPLNAAEPLALKLVLNARISTDMRPRAGDHMGVYGDLFVYPGSGADVAAATSLISTLKSGGTFTVQAYNDGHHLLQASGFTVSAPR